MTMSPVEEQMEISLGEVSEAHLPPATPCRPVGPCLL